jgi:hypothetical protein
MFCPNCEAEYRPGFTRCSDCEVALVARLEERDIPNNNPELSGTPELLWTGMDAATRDGIVAALETEKIPYHERRNKVGALRNWPEEVYAIFIHARDHRAADAALQAAVRLRESAPDDSGEEPLHSSAPLQESPESDDEYDASDFPLDYVPDNFDPDEATAEVWSGQDPTTRENLITCLRNIGVGSAIDDSAGRLRIRVTPSSQKRASETIRQVIEASEP